MKRLFFLLVWMMECCLGIFAQNNIHKDTLPQSIENDIHFRIELTKDSIQLKTLSTGDYKASLYKKGKHYFLITNDSLFMGLCAKDSFSRSKSVTKNGYLRWYFHKRLKTKNVYLRSGFNSNFPNSKPCILDLNNLDYANKGTIKYADKTLNIYKAPALKQMDLKIEVLLSQEDTTRLETLALRDDRRCDTLHCKTGTIISSLSVIRGRSCGIVQQAYWCDSLLRDDFNDVEHFDSEYKLACFAKTGKIRLDKPGLHWIKLKCMLNGITPVTYKFYVKVQEPVISVLPLLPQRSMTVTKIAILLIILLTPVFFWINLNRRKKRNYQTRNNIGQKNETANSDNKVKTPVPQTKTNVQEQSAKTPNVAPARSSTGDTDMYENATRSIERDFGILHNDIYTLLNSMRQMKRRFEEIKSQNEKLTKELDISAKMRDDLKQEMMKLRKEYDYRNKEFEYLKCDMMKLREEHDYRNENLLQQLELERTKNEFKKKELQRQIEEQQSVIVNKQKEIDQCKQQINVPSIGFVKQQMVIIKYVDVLIANWADCVLAAPDNTACATITNNIQKGFNDFLGKFKALTEGVFAKSDVPFLSVIKAYKELLLEGLCRSGWINEVAYLNCCSHIPVVAEVFSRQNLDTATFARIYGEILGMLGAAGIRLFSPNLLIDTFNESIHTYNSDSDVRITAFCDAINPKDYPGKLFDMVQVGYTIGMYEEHKPVVIYY